MDSQNNVFQKNSINSANTFFESNQQTDLVEIPAQVQHVQKAALESGMPVSNNFVPTSRSKVPVDQSSFFKNIGSFIKNAIKNIKLSLTVFKMNGQEKAQKINDIKNNIITLSPKEIKANLTFLKLLRQSGLSKDVDEAAKECESRLSKLQDNLSSLTLDSQLPDSDRVLQDISDARNRPSSCDSSEQNLLNPENNPPAEAKVTDNEMPEYVLPERKYSQEELDKALEIPTAPRNWKPVNINYENMQKFNHKVIDHVNPREIPLSEVVSLVKICVANNDRNGLRILANMLFDGSNERCKVNEDLKSIKLLKELFFHPGINNLCIGKMLIKAFSDWQDNYHVPRAFYRKPPNKNLVVQGKEVAPKEEVSIYHGGGFNNIKRFMEGESSGYQLEAGHVGLQVCCGYDERVAGYAENAWAHFDLPAKVVGKVKAEELIPAQSSSEASLTHVIDDYEIVVYRDKKPVCFVYHSSDFPRDSEGSFIDKTFSDDTWEAIQDSLDEFYKNNPELANKKSLEGFPASYFLDAAPSNELNEKIKEFREKAQVKHNPPSMDENTAL